MSRNVLLYIPNIIGYTRIILLLYSCWVMRTDWWNAIVAYILSASMDAIDGYLARLLNQSSKFGAMLDMLTDRCSTLCLLACLCRFYPTYMFAFQVYIVVDIASHWLHMHSSIAGGKRTHKLVDPRESRLLHFYYSSKVVLFTLCMGNELFMCALYVCYFTNGPIAFVGIGLFRLLAYICAPMAVAKFGCNLLQLYYAALNMVDQEEVQESNAGPSKECKCT